LYVILVNFTVDIFFINRMKKVLIICDTFPPAFAPRMGYLCKYLPLYGWEPVIVTEFHHEQIYNELAKDKDATHVNYYQSKNKLIQKIRYTFVFLADFFFDYKDFVIKKAAQKQIKKHDISLILSSAYRTFPMKAAYRLSKRNKLPIVMDLRDIVEQFPNNEHISKKLSRFKWLNDAFSNIITWKILRQRNKTIPKSDYITTVSEFHVETLKKYNDHVCLIYNGYAPEFFFPKIKQAQTFNIVYTGRIMSTELEDPTLLFEAIGNLSKKGLITDESCRIQFYTDDKTKVIVEKLAKEYQIEKFVDCFDRVSSSSIPDILHDASVLLLLTNKHQSGSRGIMTTKYFEYLAVEKPILCIRNDEDCLEKSVKETQSGIAADNVKQVENFILEKYAEWKQNGYTHQKINRQIAQQFSRKEQAKQFVSIFESLIEKSNE